LNLRIWCLLLLWFSSAAGHAQVFDRLYTSSPQPALSQPLEWVATPKGSVLTPDQFGSLPAAWRFQPYSETTVLPTSDNQEVWARFTVPVTTNRQVWFVRMAPTSIFKISFYSRDATGGWQVQSSGQSIAPAQWALRTRFPSFEVQSSSTGEQTYYMRFEHRLPITERPMLLTPIEYVDGSSRVGIVIGLLMGMFGLVCVLCVAAYAMARNTVFLWFAGFVVALMFSQLTLLGFVSWRIWPDSAHANQVMGWVSGCLALAAGAWFCARASYAWDSHIWIYRLLCTLAAASLLLALLALPNVQVFPRDMQNAWAALVTVVVMCSLAWMALRGQRWNASLLVGLMPIGLATTARLAYDQGWVQQLELAQTAGIFSAILGLLWLMLGLLWRNRTALMSTALAQALDNYDAGTGLVQERVVRIRLPQMLRRAAQLKIGCGAIQLRWVNHAQLMASVSTDKQQAMRRQVGQILNGVTRDIDTAGCLGVGQFMILVEGLSSRSSLTSLSTQLSTAFIRASDRFDLPNAFNFHIAIWQANVAPCTDQEVLEALETRLNQMSHGTKRTVQFVDTAAPDAGTEQQDGSKLRREELIAKIDAIEALPSLRATLSDNAVQR
jgi:hypothetical protein